ncbi:diguanylate cyclase [Sporosarcina siberiensis]|uniref:Diguanylate cyclase n=1 Tax=Sporosarcina siberiensis TaxID=1365606 RepID=A0ABW4SL19_9BACL
MTQEDYRQKLMDRIKDTFLEWKKKESISESELYLFLHTLKGTSGTIGMEELSIFCSGQLEILSPDNESKIPVHTLNNFKKRILQYLNDTDEKSHYKLPDTHRYRFDVKTSILIIDDDLEFVSFVKEFLESMGAQVIIALNAKRGLEQFYSVRPGFVLIDINLPDMTGFEVLNQIAETAQARHVTIAVTSVDGSSKNRIMAFEKGAMDFLSKPLDTEIFVAYLINRDKMRKEIEISVITDGLTGLGNRRYFDDMCVYFAESYARAGMSFSLVMMDIDHFKKVNDAYGHPAGDNVLRKLGEIVLEECRETDHAFRYGGEEFAFLLQGASSIEATVFVDRIRKKFNAAVFSESNSEFSVTFSTGISSYKGDLKELISSADKALYEAKRSGRNQTVIFNKKTSQMNRKLHIILVDDDRLIRSMLAEELAKWVLSDIDISIHVFADGPSFLESDWYSPEEYYIILLDRIMPEMDGLEVLELLKRDTNKRNVLVSMMTARTEESDIKEALGLGADDYIMKPFQPADVLFRVQQLATRILLK